MQDTHSKVKGGSSIFCSCDSRQPTCAGSVLGVGTHCSGLLVCITRENLSYQLVGFQEIVNGKLVLLRSDNATVVLYVNKEGGTRSPSLCVKLREVMMWCLEHGVSLWSSAHCGIRQQVGGSSLKAGGCIFRVEF